MIEGHRRSQIMQAYAICHGITAKTSTMSSDLAMASLDGHKRLASYQFHPVSEKTGKVGMDHKKNDFQNKKYFIIWILLYTMTYFDIIFRFMAHLKSY